MDKSVRDHAGRLHPDRFHLHHHGGGLCIGRTAAHELFKNGRTVDDRRAWLKRIVITWAILNGLGFIMAYITPFFSGGTWTPGATP